MKRWYREEYAFDVEALSVKPDGEPVGHCRNGHEAGDRYACGYECPAGFCQKSMAKLFPLMEAVRAGGDLRLLGGAGRHEMTFTCPDGVVTFRLRARRTDENGEIIHTLENDGLCAPDPDARVLADMGTFNRHLALCEQSPVCEAHWAEISRSGTTYYGLFEGDQPVARAAIERYSGDAWETADVRTARAYRGRGYATRITSHVTALIRAAGKTATCRTLPGNAAMLRVMAKLGYRP